MQTQTLLIDFLHMIDFHDLIPLFLATIVLALKPGPYMLALSSLAVRGDVPALFCFWLGSVTTVSLMYYLVLTGLSAIPDNFGLIFIFLKALAAVIFVSMGVLAVQEQDTYTEEEIEARVEKISARKALANISAGVTLGLSNPYDILFIFTAVPGLTGLTVFALQDVVVIRGTVILADVLVLCAYCIPLILIQKKLPRSLLRKVRIACGFLMIGIGVFLMINIALKFDLIKSDLVQVL